MFNINGWELVIIVVLALIVFGPERLPQAAAQAGRALHQLQRMTAVATADLTREFQAAIAEAERAQAELAAAREELRQAAGAATDELGQAADTISGSSSPAHPPAGGSPG